MRKFMLVAALAIAVSAMSPGAASAQSDLVEVSNPGNFSLDGTARFKIRHASTGAVLINVLCDVDADASLDYGGTLDIYDWEPSGSSAYAPFDCNDSGGWDDCDDGGLAGDVVPPGTEWSVGSGFSVYMSQGFCFAVWGGSPIPSVSPMPLLELSGDATSWTSAETQFGYYNGHPVSVEFDLTSDTSFEISEIEE
jgi:hypothetical protein